MLKINQDLCATSHIDQIINIKGTQEEYHYLHSWSREWAYSTFLEPRILKLFINSRVPCFRCLLQSIQCLFQLVNMILLSFHFKALMMLNINLSIQITLKNALFTSMLKTFYYLLAANERAIQIVSCLATKANVSS